MSSCNGKTLLIVDDDRPFGAMLGWAFEDLGYSVVLAGSCKEAVDLLAGARFDVALLDYGLPDGNGHALSTRLTAQQPGLSVVMMSADRDGALAGIGGPPAALGFLQKPFSPSLAETFFSGGPAAEPSTAEA